MKQVLENLPKEIKDSRRFFPVAANKAPLQKEWSNPDNQTTLEEINGLAGFDTVGHGRGVDYLFFDFDHVLTDNGEFVNDNAADFVNNLQLTFPQIYIEKSISGTGLHAFLVPTADRFAAISNGKLGVLHFDDSKEKNAPKLEMFYGSGGRYCLVTGILYDEGNLIPSGVEVDKFLSETLAEIKKQLEKRGEKLKPARQENIFADKSADSANPTEYQQALILAMLEVIDFSQLEDSQWLAIMTACKNWGVPYSVVDSFNRRDSESYNEKENKTRWDSLKESYGLETIIGIAERFGFSVKDFYKQWHSDIGNLKVELQEVNTKIAAFEVEKEAAINRVKDIGTFNRETVLSEENLKAAAFAKKYNAAVFADYKKAIQNWNKAQNDGVNLPDFSAVLKDYENEISSRSFELKKRYNEIQAQIKTLEFINSNPVLSDFDCPEDFIISDEGVGKIEGIHVKPICRLPVVVTKKYIYVDEEKIKLELVCKNSVGSWYSSAPTERAIIANARKLVDLANNDFPFTSQNAGGVVDYLDAFLTVNEEKLKTSYAFNHFGRHEYKGQKFFLDPRHNTSIEVDGKKYPVRCTSKSQFARALKSVGSLEQWKQIYAEIKKYPVARAMVAAMLVAPLLEILGERGFWIHIYTKTLSGKTTALKFATSAVGKPDGIIKTFNATINGLQGVAAEYNCYSFPLDEWQAASPKMQAQVGNLIHNLIDGTARTKMNKDSTVRENETWLTAVITTGESSMLNDNSLGGEFTRVLNIAAPSPILPPKLCKDIHETIKDNYGLIFPLYLEEIEKRGDENLREIYSDFVEIFTKEYPNILPEYCRYIAALSLADFLLNVALGENEETANDAATDNAAKILKLVPTLAEIDDTSRAKEMILGFIAENSAYFEGLTGYDPKYHKPLGRKGDVADPYFYITVKAVKFACTENQFDYNHLAKNLTDEGFFVRAETIEPGHNKPRPSVMTRIGDGQARCYRIKKADISKSE